MSRSIFAIVNPASGGDSPILNTFNTVFNTAGWDWDIGITKKFGDARQMAENAAKDKYDIVAIYGGDGSVMEAATGLMGTGKPGYLSRGYWECVLQRAGHPSRSPTGLRAGCQWTKSGA